MSAKPDSKLFQGSFFRIRYLSSWEYEIIEDVACFYREDVAGVLQVAASRKAEGELDLVAEMKTYLNRNQVDLEQVQLVEYMTSSGLPAIATEYWHKDRFWLVQFLGESDRLLIVLYNGEHSPDGEVAQQISGMLGSIEFI